MGRVEVRVPAGPPPPPPHATLKNLPGEGWDTLDLSRTIYSHCKVAKVDDSIQDENGGVFVKDENGHLTGQLFEEPAITRVIGCSPQPTAEELSKAVWDQWKDYASRGFTTVTEIGYIRNEDLDSLLDTISKSNSCPIRLALYRLVHGPESEENCSRKRLAVCCPQLARVGKTPQVGLICFYSKD